MNEGSYERVVVVTGATRGIGRGVAEHFARLGMSVLVGARDVARGEEVAAPLRAAGADAHALALDVTAQASVDAAAAYVQERYGHVDVLVNNAGITGSGRVDPAEAYDQVPSAVDVDMVRSVFETNVLGVIRVTNALLPLLRKAPHARIVNVSSHGGSVTLNADPAGPMAALLPSAAYIPSKSALNALTVQYAKELRDTGVRVIAVAPGFVATDSNDHTGILTVAQAAEVVANAATSDASPASPAGFVGGEGPVPW